VLYIELNAARICINCGTIHDVKIENSYGKGDCPQCKEKMCVTMQAYINTMTEKEVCI
jgi:hypothetical protein